MPRGGEKLLQHVKECAHQAHTCKNGDGVTGIHVGTHTHTSSITALCCFP